MRNRLSSFSVCDILFSEIFNALKKVLIMKYGFIGCGNMGGAVARALSKATTDILVTDRSGKAKALAQELAVSYGDNETVAWECERIFLCVKPQMMAQVLAPLQGILAQTKPLLISMAAGLSLDKIQAMAGTTLPVIRIMPNTPVAVGKGMIPYCHNALVSKEVLSEVVEYLRFAGKLDAIDEKLIDAASALSGCGPAYLYMFLEALADGAVACGLPREKALEYAATTMAGAAEMALTSNAHPGALKDAVCSPGGSTIAGVQTLEQQGFRGTVIDCIHAAFQRTKELGKD